MPDKTWTGPHLADQGVCPHCKVRQNLELHGDKGVVDLGDSPVFVCDGCNRKYEVVRAEVRQVIWLRPVE